MPEQSRHTGTTAAAESAGAEPSRHTGTTAAGGCPAHEIVRVDHTNWRTYRDVRLASLIESAPWFGTTYPQAARFSDEDWRSRASSDTLTFWLAMAGDLPLGTVGLAVEDADGVREGMLIGMWVVPRERGRGIAEALVQEVRREADRRSCHRLVLHVDVENGRAQALYRRAGFAPIGVIEAGPGERDELVMQARGI